MLQLQKEYHGIFDDFRVSQGNANSGFGGDNNRAVRMGHGFQEMALCEAYQGCGS